MILRNIERNTKYNSMRQKGKLKAFWQGARVRLVLNKDLFLVDLQSVLQAGSAATQLRVSLSG